MENQSTDTSKKSEFEKAFLEHNVWPSIRACVQNRYFIVSGGVAFYSAALQYPKIQSVSLLATLGLIAATIVNCLNYNSNARRQKEILSGHGVEIGTQININFLFTTGIILFLICGHEFVLSVPKVLTEQDVNMTFWQLIGTSQMESLTAILALAATVYFTRTLVKNDNRREERAEHERMDKKREEIIEWCINEWKKTSSPGGLQTAGSNAVKKFGKDKVDIIIESYEIFVNQSEGSPNHSKREFVGLMWGLNDENKEIWPPF